MNIVDQVKFDLEHLEYTDYVNEKMADDYYIVVSFITYKDPCRPSVVLRKICNGEEIKTRIKQSKIFKESPFGLYSILKVDEFAHVYKKKKIGDAWVDSDELEDVLEQYEVMKG